MNYLFFVGLSFLAAVALGGAAAFVGGIPGLVIAMVVTGTGFAFARPVHLKFGYLIWGAMAFILYALLRWEAEIELNDPEINPRGVGVGVGLTFIVGTILLNPISYWLGKRLSTRFARSSAASSA
jgi:hypothetical protein